MRKSSSYQRSSASPPAAIAWLKVGASNLMARCRRSLRMQCRFMEARNRNQHGNLRIRPRVSGSFYRSGAPLMRAAALSPPRCDTFMKMIRLTSSLRVAGTAVFAASICLAAAGLLLSRPPSLHAQPQKIIWSNQEKPIADQIRSLRSLPDDVRARVTKNLAVEIRQLPVTPNKLRLANDLANLSTEGDFGRDTLQEVATTLATALHEQPIQAKQGQPPRPYVELAQLVRYEHVQASLDDPQLAAAISKIERDNERRQQADFTLAELNGKSWTLKELRGKVVLVNFWATWCPPCRKEMPDLETLYKQFKDQGLVILAISD